MSPFPVSRPWARFDDLTTGGAFSFDEVEHEVVARRPQDVAAALDEVDRRTAEGLWAWGFVTYEAAPGFDPVLRTLPPQAGLPLVWFGLSAAPRVVPVVAPPRGTQPPAWGSWTCAWDASTHAEKVEAVRAAIARGDTYQVNLTTRLTSDITDDGAVLDQDWYASLAWGQRGRFNALLDVGRFVIGSASPELFVELGGPDGRAVRMSPMKGTTRRGATPEDDAALVAGLLTSPKEQAENLMIVDLIRNDLARIAEVGTVEVPALCRAERYETVHQLVSDVTATLRPGTALTDVFRGLFPCGSITGAPKAGTMRLIAALEAAPRGVYCGAIGVVAPPDAGVPRARFSVAIRTVVLDREGGTAAYGAGGGITWSSNPDAEYAELLAKTAVLARQDAGLGLVETMRHEAGSGVVHLERHLARLATSAAAFGLPCDLDGVRRAVAAATGDPAPGPVPGHHSDGRRGGRKVRLVLSSDGSPAVEVGPLPDASAAPVRLAVDTVPVCSTDWWCRHKTTWRAPYDARRARHPEADDVLMVNERGEVTETTIATVLAHIDGRWVTPPLESGCLPGVVRGVLLDAGEVEEGVLCLADLRRADAIHLVNALRGRRVAQLL